MAGVKGRSGRKTRVSENSRDEVILQSWDIIKRFFAAEDITLARKAEIASRLCVKNMPQEVDGNLNVNFTIKELVSDVNRRAGANRVSEALTN